VHLGDDAGTNGTTTFAESEAETGLHGDRVNEFENARDVVARHHHLGSLWESNVTGDVGGAHEELRAVVGEERGVATAFFLLEDVNLSLKLAVRLDGARLAEHLAAQDFVTLQTAEQQTAVVASLAFVERLLEHFNASHRGLLRRGDTDNVNVVTGTNDALFDATSRDSAATLNTKHIFNRHGKRLVERAGRFRNVTIDSLHEFDDSILTNGVFGALESVQSRTLDDWNVVARKLVKAEQLAKLHLDELDELLVVNHVNLVEEHNQRRDPNLSREQNVLASLRHRTIRRGHDENAAIHLRRPGDHILHVISVTRAIDVRIVTRIRLILNVGRRNRDTPRLFFRRLINLIKRDLLRPADFRHDPRDRRRQRRLSVIDVPDRPHVQVRLRSRVDIIRRVPARRDPDSPRARRRSQSRLLGQRSRTIRAQSTVRPRRRRRRARPRAHERSSRRVRSHRFVRFPKPGVGVEETVGRYERECE
jgi:hypothetical protein